MTNLLRSLHLNSKYFKIIASFVLLYFYCFWLHYFLYGFLLLIMGFTYYAYVTEVQRIASGDEYFKDDNIFFRYGALARSYVFPIRTKDHWSQAESRQFADELVGRFQNDLRNMLSENPLEGKHEINIIGVFDQNRPRNGRGFLKSAFTGVNGAMVTNVITYQLVGKTVALHHETYTLGWGRWYDILYFVVMSPITIITWIVSWLRNLYSVRAAINRDVNNSFEQYDLDSFYSASIEVVTETLRRYLKEKDLYTDYVSQTIQNFIDVGNNNIFNIGDNNVIVR